MRACLQVVNRSSWRDLQRCDPAALEREDEPKIHWTAGEVTRYPTRHDVLAICFLERDRFGDVRVLGGCDRLPGFDRRQAGVRLSLIRDYRLVREAARDSVTVAPVCLEVGGDRFREIQLFHCGLQQRFRGTTMTCSHR